jgi:phosphoenolpyruvate-protein kinase (PTS system EI component)
MSEHRLQGLPGAPGAAAGTARVLAAAIRESGFVAADRRPAELDRARAALAAAAAELEAIAARLPPEEAEVVATGALMAADPALDAAVERGTTSGLPAGAAIVRACDEHATAIAAIGDERLAARAEDVRSLGRRAARIAAGDASPEAGDEPIVLVAEDLGPADVAELDSAVVAIALAGGAQTGHAAIVARGLGIPLALRLGPDVLDARGIVAVDGDAGTAVLSTTRRSRPRVPRTIAAVPSRSARWPSASCRPSPATAGACACWSTPRPLPSSRRAWRPAPRASA